MKAKLRILAYENGYMGMLLDIAVAAEKIGLGNSVILPQAYAITGTIEATKTEELEKIRGVKSVEIIRYDILAPASQLPVQPKALPGGGQCGLSLN
jgi:hypothetical protein